MLIRNDKALRALYACYKSLIRSFRFIFKTIWNIWIINEHYYGNCWKNRKVVVRVGIFFSFGQNRSPFVRAGILNKPTAAPTTTLPSPPAPRPRPRQTHTSIDYLFYTFCIFTQYKKNFLKTLLEMTSELHVTERGIMGTRKDSLLLRPYL